jgi:predicted metal-dependent peptidase
MSNTPSDPNADLTDEEKKQLEELKKRAREAGIRSREEALEASIKEAVSAEEQKQCLQTAIFSTTKTNPFMGSVLQCMNMTYSHMLPTAGVMFNAELKRWDLLINPYFFCRKLNEAQRKAVLLHELYHITHKHPLRVPFMKLSVHKRRLMNIAMDMAINQFIKDLPVGCPLCPPREPGEFGGAPCENPDCCGSGIMIKDFYDTDKSGKQTQWETRQPAEHYYEKLMERFKDPDPEDKNNEGQGQGNAGGGATSGDLPSTTDVHHWDGSSEEKDMLEATEDLVKRAMIKCKFGHDDIPGHIRELLDHIKQRKAELDYKRLILQAMKSSLPANFRIKSWTRKSKRYGNMAPGNKNGDQPKLDNFIDTSGSISIEEANNFLDIVDEFLRVGAKKCTLNMFHTSNYYREDYKRGQRIKREDIKSGGTCLEDSFRTIAKTRPDLAIVLTDGYYSNVDTKALVGPNGRFPNTVFIISKDGTTEHPFKNEPWAKTVQIPGGNKRS